MRKVTISIAALVLASCGSPNETAVKIYVNQKLYDKAIAQGNLALKTNPNNGDTYYFLGAAYYGKDAELKTEAASYGDSSEAFLKRAFECFEKAKALTPASWGKSADDNITSMFGRHYNRGVIAAKKSAWAEASLEYRLASIADPENFESYYAHAGSLWPLAVDAKKAGRDQEFTEMTDAILKDLDRVIELKPSAKEKLVATYQTKGDVLYKRGDTKGAQDNYSQAVALDPENYELIMTMADRFYTAGDWENAIKYLQDELSIQERLKLIDAEDADGYTALANALSKLNRREEAIAAYQKVLELKPNDTISLFNVGVMHFKMGEESEKNNKAEDAKNSYNQALVIMNELIRVDPSNCRCYQVRGFSERGVGDTAAAARDLKKYADCNSGTAKN